MGVRDGATHRPRDQADPRPVGRGRLGARPGPHRSGRQRPGRLPEAGESLMSAVEDRLAELGLTVPEVAKPVAAYVPAIQDGRRIYTSGQLPMVSGALAETGKVGVGEGLVSPKRAAELAQICALNAIAAVKGLVGDLDK